MKQMKIIHNHGFSKDEKDTFSETLFTTVLTNMRAILSAMKSLSISFENPENQKYADIMRNVQFDIDLKKFKSAEVSAAISALWMDEGVQACYEKSSEYELDDSAG